MAAPFDDRERGLDDRGLALQDALDLAYGSGLRLVDVAVGEDRLEFVFDRRPRSLDEAWRHLFGVGATAAKDPVAAAWFEQHPEMRHVLAGCVLQGARLVLTRGAAAAYARVREVLKLQHPFLGQLQRHFGSIALELSEGQKVFAPCHARRFDAAAYVDCLMSLARSEWRRLASGRHIVGGIPRAGLDEPYRVRPLDRTRVLAVLEAWARDARYLDAVLFARCHRFRPRLPPEQTVAFVTEDCERVRIGAGEVHTALRLISMPAVHRGALRCVPTPGALVGFGEVFVSPPSPVAELRSGLDLFGEGAGTETPDVDAFFTALLEWDGAHCYGLLLELRLLGLWQRGAGGDLPELEQAACAWVLQRRRDGELPYARYPLLDDEAGLLDRVADLEFDGY